MQIGLLEAPAMLGLIGQCQSHGGETGNGFLGFRIHADPDAEHEFVSLFVKPRSGDEIELVLGGLRLGQGLLQNDDRGLTPDGFIGGRVRGSRLSYCNSGRHREEKKTEVISCFHHESSRFELNSVQFSFQRRFKVSACMTPWFVWLMWLGL